MKVLVTGATGFIGQVLAKKLLNRKHQVVIITRDEKKARKLFKDKVSIFKADITDRKSLESLSKDFQILFHLAAAVSYRRPSKKNYYSTNVLGSENVLRETRRMTKLKKIVYVSSAGVYGPIENPPIDETFPHKPETDYEISKEKGETIAREYIQKGLPINIIQPTLVYGPGDLASGIFSLFKAVAKGMFMKIGKKEVLMHPAYIDDVVNALILASQKKVTGETFIIGDEKTLSLSKMAELIAKESDSQLLPFYLPYPFARLAGILGDVGNKFGIAFPITSITVSFMTHHRAYVITKAKRVLGYQPKVPFEKGVKKTFLWYKKKGYL